jgi:hypothetical protein
MTENVQAAPAGADANPAAEAEPERPDFAELYAVLQLVERPYRTHHYEAAHGLPSWSPRTLELMGTARRLAWDLFANVERTDAQHGAAMTAQLRRMRDALEGWEWLVVADLIQELLVRLHHEQAVVSALDDLAEWQSRQDVAGCPTKSPSDARTPRWCWSAWRRPCWAMTGTGRRSWS